MTAFRAPAEVRTAILDLLARRRPGATICPSEAARALAPGEEFRELMPIVREAARELVSSGQLEVTQHGQAVDLDTARGPIRLRRAGGERPGDSHG